MLAILEELCLLGRAEIVAHDAGPDDPHTREILSTVYQERPGIEQELDVLESGSAKDIFQAVR